MNKWLYRAVSTVGVASGILMLGGAAYAQDAAAAPQADPQALQGLLAGVFSPTSGLSDLGLSADLSGAGADTTAAGPLQLRANDGRPEFLPALDGLTGGLTGGSGLTGMLGGLTGSGSPLSLVGGVTGNLTGGAGAASETDATGGLLGGLTGGDLLGGSDKGGLLGGLTGGDSPAGGLLGGLTGKLTGGDAAQGATAPAATTPQFTQTGLTNGSPNVQTNTGLPADLDPQTAKQVSQAAQDLVPSMIAQAMAKASTGMTPVSDPSQFAPAGDPNAFDPSQLGLTADDLAGLSADDLAALSDDSDLTDDGTDQSQFFADNPNVAVNWVGPAGGTTATPVQDPAQFGMPVSTESATEALPVVDQLPLVGPMLGDSGLGKLIVVGNIAQKLPLVGSVLDNQGLPSLDSLPVVNQVLNRGLISNGQGGGGLPVVGNLPVVGDLLGGGDGGLLGGLTGGDSPLGGLTSGLTGGLTGGSSPLGGLTGGLTGGSSPLGGITGGLLGGAAAQPTTLPAPGMSTAMPLGALPTSVTRVAPHATARTAARHAETDRPIAGEDADYPSARPEATGAEGGLPLLGSLGSMGSTGALPVSHTLAQLPLVGDLPVVGSLPVPLALLRGLPVVGSLAGLLPIE
ncbi:hypothetical protein [Hamadaea tsunoensis]|uniref:hypothetical protein n=1 Tax=Hamadaea tsunoensis TaxID=53368 RepID=UPI0012FB573D|nr:hypothetical protein [Hamadaea tsunoensis]